MPLKLDLSSYDERKVPETTIQQKPDVLDYAGAILRGVGHGFTNLACAVRDMAVYPILDAYTLLSLATHPDIATELDDLLALHPAFYEGLQERMESRVNTLCHLTLLALDAGIIGARYQGYGVQDTDFQAFSTLIERHPSIYDEAEARMHQRATHWCNQYDHFMHCSGIKKIELVSETVTSFLAFGSLAKSLKIVATGVNNYRDFGLISTPPKFWPTASAAPGASQNLFSMPVIKLLKIDEIKASVGMTDCIWVITKDNQLLLAPAKLPATFSFPELKFVSEPVKPQYLTRYARADWVYASGEAIFSDGRLLGIFKDEQVFRSAGRHLETLVETVFAGHGFPKGTYKMSRFSGWSDVSLSSVKVPPLTKGERIAMTTTEVSNTLLALPSSEIQEPSFSEHGFFSSKKTGYFASEFSQYFLADKAHETSVSSRKIATTSDVHVSKGSQGNIRFQNQESSHTDVSRAHISMPSRFSSATANRQITDICRLVPSPSTLPSLPGSGQYLANQTRTYFEPKQASSSFTFSRQGSIGPVSMFFQSSRTGIQQIHSQLQDTISGLQARVAKLK